MLEHSAALVSQQKRSRRALARVSKKVLLAGMSSHSALRVWRKARPLGSSSKVRVMPTRSQLSSESSGQERADRQQSSRPARGAKNRSERGGGTRIYNYHRKFFLTIFECKRKVRIAAEKYDKNGPPEADCESAKNGLAT